MTLAAKRCRRCKAYDTLPRKKQQKKTKKRLDTSHKHAQTFTPKWNK